MPTAAEPDPFEPVVIRSRYAEIVYFASPEYDETIPTIDPAYPQYIDVDGETNLTGPPPMGGRGDENGFPDRLKLHRRVLLIRPDLNLQNGRLPVRDNGTVTFMEVEPYPNNWQVAMASVHHQCDLSVRRVLSVSSANRGRPTIRVAANSLEDLAKPHHRFAHVRIPRATFGRRLKCGRHFDASFSIGKASDRIRHANSDEWRSNRMRRSRAQAMLS